MYSHGSPQQSNYSWHQQNVISPFASPHMYGYPQHSSVATTPSPTSYSGMMYPLKPFTQSPSPLSHPQSVSPAHRTQIYQTTPTSSPESHPKPKYHISYSPPPSPPPRPLSVKEQYYLQSAGITLEEFKQRTREMNESWRREGRRFARRLDASNSSSSEESTGSVGREVEQRAEPEGSDDTGEKHDIPDSRRKVEGWRAHAGISTPEEWDADSQRWRERCNAHIARSRLHKEQNPVMSVPEQQYRDHESGRGRRGRTQPAVAN